ncbi:hypothetical protein EWM64_g6142 [Hericium alpestre]|uniref:Uncharacterized protein n=1 Tax=Hericium alpestre TaxID=135208 RepID=A0A4Y9ZSL3_9AGAM|nr:hypothetical protein EWM64_g6142 [Hericium alpestre]
MTDVSPATGSPAFDLSSALRPALDSADSAACTTSSSSSMSPRSDIFDFPGDLSLAFGPQLDAFGDSLSKALPPDILDPFPEHSLSSQGISPVALGNFFWNDAHPQSAESAPLSSFPMDMIDAEPSEQRTKEDLVLEHVFFGFIPA